MALRLRQAFTELVFAVYLLGLTEWLFQVTKPSFMSTLSALETLRVLLVSPLYLILSLLPLQALLALSPVAWAAAIVPSAVHSMTALLLADNFAYTLFGVGVASVSGGTRWAFAGVWLAAAVAITWRRTRRMASGRPLRFRGAAVVVGAALTVAGVRLAAAPSPATIDAGEATARRRPDILFISLDGTEATHTSLLGYGRDTTPVLDRLAETSLVFENAFSNNCYTTGALLALLSGKRPTDFRVFYPPTTLQGAHAYQHLPALLRRLGYRTAQYTPSYWATAPWQDMRNAFDWVNGVDVRTGGLPLPAALGDFLPAERYFLMQTHARLAERTLHLLGIDEMQQPMDVARNRLKMGDMGDASRVGGALRFLADNPAQPAFVQVHLMRGHCCRYVVPREQRKHSLAVNGHVPTLEDFYDDAIRLMDADVGKFVTALERGGRLDQVLIVVTADHGMRWQTSARVPLLIRLPGSAPRGRVSTNAQLADVAPTVLDYLGIPTPSWMTGQSLLEPGQLDPLRPIISASRVERSPYRFPKPPLLGLRALSATVCERHYELDLTTGELATVAVAGHTAPCAADQPPAGAVKSFLTEHLAARGFGAPTAAGVPGSRR